MRTKLVITFLGAALALALAGCAVPEEAGEGADDGMGGAETPEYIMVNGATYECDDTINADGICDGYELNEGEAGEGTQTLTEDADGGLTVGGYTYTCDNTDVVDVDVTDATDTAGQCERYDRDE